MKEYPQLKEIDHYPYFSAALTGHRPKDLNGMTPQENSTLLWRLNEVIDQHIEDGITQYFTGMALGVDTWAAQTVLKFRDKFPYISLIAAIPCLNQEKLWPQKDRDLYHEILKKCDAVIYVSEEEYQPWLMEQRNRFMVDNSRKIIAVYNGAEKGGTYNCVKYAQKQNKEITIINPKDYK